MPQVSWQMMMSECPAAAHVVTGLLPREDAAAGRAGTRGFLLGRLARTLRLSGMYAIAEIVERDWHPRPMCFGFSQRGGQAR
jgi:hypothetical protein